MTKHNSFRPMATTTTNLDARAVDPAVRLVSVTDMLYAVMVITYLVDDDIPYKSACVGTLIRPNMVLTSEYCVMTDPHTYPQPENVLVFDRLKNMLQASMVFVRPREAEENPQLNLALVVCEEDSTILTFPNLPTGRFTLSSAMCKVGGFGINSNIQRLDNFKINPLEKGGMASCNYRNDTAIICLHLTFLIPCVGDVASPLVCEGTLHALYTPPHYPFYYRKCMDRTVTMFTPVYPALEWIANVQHSLDKRYPDWLTKPWAILLLSFLILLITAGIYKALILCVERKFSLMLRPDSEAPHNSGIIAHNTLLSSRHSNPGGTRVKINL